MCETFTNELYEGLLRVCMDDEVCRFVTDFIGLGAQLRCLLKGEQDVPSATGCISNCGRFYCGNEGRTSNSYWWGNTVFPLQPDVKQSVVSHPQANAGWMCVPELSIILLLESRDIPGWVQSTYVLTMYMHFVFFSSCDSNHWIVGFTEICL